MRRSVIVLAIAFAAALLLFAQRTQYPSHVPFETAALFPHEVQPGIYKQVEQREVEDMSEQGWELAGVTPYVYRNEERGSNNPKAVVMQTYPAYFFKRAKMIR